MAKDEPKVTDRARCVAGEVMTVILCILKKPGGIHNLEQGMLDRSLDREVAAMIDEGMEPGHDISR